MSNTDAGSSNVSESLCLNRGNPKNGDSGNVLMRTCLQSSTTGESLVEVDPGDSGTGT